MMRFLTSTNGHRWFVRVVLTLVLLLVLAGGCASSGDPSVDGNVSEVQTGQEMTLEKDNALAHIKGTSEHDLRLWQWIQGGELVIVYGDGKVGIVGAGGSEVSLTVPKFKGSPSGFSPDGTLLWVDDAGRMTIIDVADATMSLPLNKVGRLEHIAASPDSKILYGAEPGGDLHIWREMHTRLRTPDTNLETLVERQLPDATAHIGVASPMFVASRGELLFGDARGRLTRWHADDPEAITRMAELDAPLNSVAEGNDFYVATARNGRLSVVDMEYGENSWSENAKAHWATASPRWPNRALVIADGKLSALDAKTGDLQWSVPMPTADVCGLSMSPDGRSIGVCVGNQVAIVSRDDGGLKYVVTRDGDTLHLK